MSDFNDQIRHMVRDLGERTFTKPDDDWQPVAFGAKGRELFPIAIDPRHFADDAGKDQLIAQLRDITIQLQFEQLALLNNMWFKAIKRDRSELAVPAHEATTYAELGVTPPSQDPTSLEALLLLTFSATEMEASIAFIERSSDKPPVLTPWSSEYDGHPLIGDTPNSLQMGGRFPQPLFDAMKIAARRKEEAE